MIKYIKLHIETIGKSFLTIYLCYWAYILWNIKLGALMHPLELFIVVCIQISYSASISIYLFFLWFRKNETDKLYRNIIIATTVFTIIAFPTTYGILIFGRNLSQFNGIQIGSSDGWLAFIGSILGGIITMVALVFTLDNDRKVGERNLALKSIPLLTIELPEYQKNMIRKYTVVPFNGSGMSEYLEEDLIFPLNFILKNITDYHAKDLLFNKFYLFTFSTQYDETLVEQKNIFLSKSKLLFNFTDKVNTMLSNAKILPGRYDEKININLEYKYLVNKGLRFEITFSYFDFLNKLEHVTESEIILCFENKTSIDLKSNSHSFEFELTKLTNYSKFIK